MKISKDAVYSSGGNTFCLRMSRDQIKVFALFAMTLNHIANIFMPEGLLQMLMKDIGYCTAVTMCFFLVEGCRYTHNVRHYLARLVIFAVLSQIPFDLAFTRTGGLRFTAMNMLFTLSICLLCLIVLKSCLPYAIRVLLTAGLVFLSAWCDWPILAPAFTIIFYREEAGYITRKRAFLLCTLMFAATDIVTRLESGIHVPYAILQGLLASCGILIAMAMITFCYDPEKKASGLVRRAAKWLFYLYYPLHLLILGIIRLYVFHIFRY